MTRIALALGGAALLLTATVAATTYAQSAPTPSPRQSIIEAAAAKLGVSSTDLAQALKDARKDLGLKAHAELGKLVRDELAIAAKTVGLADIKALRQELKGSTLTAVAQKHNVASATVPGAIKADLNARIDAQVSAGKLKSDRAATLKQKAAERIDAFMTREFKAKP